MIIRDAVEGGSGNGHPYVILIRAALILVAREAAETENVQGPPGTTQGGETCATRSYASHPLSHREIDHESLFFSTPH